MNKKDILKQSFNNRTQISDETTCGCYYCDSIFKGSEIKYWLDGNKTAECPVCSVDSVIYGTKVYPVTEELLSELYVLGFGDLPLKNKNKGALLC